VRAGAAQHQAALTAAEEKYVAALAARDRTYAQEIAIFRKTVENIAATPDGAAALARFNAGDEGGALTILDDLRAARDVGRKKRADIDPADYPAGWAEPRGHRPGRGPGAPSVDARPPVWQCRTDTVLVGPTPESS
jgi:hypothetical protein